MNIIVVGCGRVGAELAYRLYLKKHRVTVVDNTPGAFANLPPDFRGRTIEGEALSREVLRRAGIEHAEGLAAVTSSDTTNLAVAHLARKIYNMVNIVTRNYNPQMRPLYEDFNLQVVSSSSWGAQRIEEMLYNMDVRTVFSAGNGEVELYEFEIPASWAGRTLGELVPDGSCAPAALTRAGKAVLPDCDSRLEAGDIVVVSATFEGIEALRTNLFADKEG